MSPSAPPGPPWSMKQQLQQPYRNKYVRSAHAGTMMSCTDIFMARPSASVHAPWPNFGPSLAFSASYIDISSPHPQLQSISGSGASIATVASSRAGSTNGPGGGGGDINGGSGSGGPNVNGPSSFSLPLGATGSPFPITPLSEPRSPGLPSRISPISKLSFEILRLVFQELHRTDSRSLTPVRLVCKSFDAIAKPLAYRTLVLNRAICEWAAETRYGRLFANISLYTTEVVVRDGLEPDGVRRLLSRVQKLKCVRWYFNDNSSIAGDVDRLPCGILEPDQIYRMRTALHFEGLPLRDFGGTRDTGYTDALPAANIVTLRMSDASPPSATELGPIKRLVVRSPRLEVLHLRSHRPGRGQGQNQRASFVFEPKERVAAIRDLSLHSYGWFHSREEVAAHWDLTCLSRLRLVSVPLYNFLSSVDLGDLAFIQSLCLDECGADLPDPSLRAETNAKATRLLHTLIRDHIVKLHHLDVTCDTRLFPLDALTKHAGTLCSLKFHDFVGFSDDDRVCPTLTAADMELLADRLVHVAVLDIDMDVARAKEVLDGDIDAFLDAVCHFPKLHSLTLHVQTVLSSAGEVKPGVDRDYHYAKRIFGHLAQRRSELGHGYPVWRRITVKVGEWRHIMVRQSGIARDSDRVLTTPGRRFVMEKGYVREETPVAPSSSRMPTLEDIQNV